jgi:hypothetical protein
LHGNSCFLRVSVSNGGIDFLVERQRTIDRDSLRQLTHASQHTAVNYFEQQSVLAARNQGSFNRHPGYWLSDWGYVFCARSAGLRYEKIVTHRLGISFMMQAWWVFCICSAIFVVVSLLTPPPAAEKIEGLTWEHPLAVVFGKKVESVFDPRIIAALLLATMAVLYYLFQ